MANISLSKSIDLERASVAECYCYRWQGRDVLVDRALSLRPVIVVL